MKIAFESELMQNQKHAEVMAPGLAFDVLQTDDGRSLFFSIGTDGVFYLTQEVVGLATGWSRIDLSSALSAQHGGAPVSGRTFAVAQEPNAGSIDVALAITVNGSDFLYLSRGNANTSASWGQGVTWTALPFDDPAHPTPVLQIADLYLLPVGSTEYFVADILKQPGSPLNPIDRYYLTPAAPQKWNPHDLAADLAAGSIQSCLGLRAGDLVAGIYTFGTLMGQPELLFTPLYNPFDPATAASPARLGVPAGAGAIAAAVNGDGSTALFVAGGGGVYLFTAANQHDGASAVQVASNPVFAGVRTLSAATTGGSTAVWGVNQQNQLFYLRCTAGHETDPSAWSYPVPLLSAVEEIAPFLNARQGSSVIFAHTQGQDVVQLTQDPVTTEWHQRSILLPATRAADFVTFDSFTTHVQVTDDFNVGSPATLAVTAASVVSVYLNDVYHVLSPDVPVNVSTDATGVLTVVQETHSLAAACLRVVVQPSGETAAINPMMKLLGTISTIQTGADLAAVRVPGADGTPQPLVPASVIANQSNTAAQALRQLVSVGSKLPPDGSRVGTAGTEPPGAAFGTGAAFPGAGAATGLANRATTPAASPAPVAGAGGSGAAAVISIAIGDFVRLVDAVTDTVESIVVEALDDAWQLTVTIGEKVWQIVVDRFPALAHALECAFHLAEVLFDDLIKWLGALLGWDDVLRAHNVLKNVFTRYAEHAVAGLTTATSAVQGLFTGLENTVNGWAGLPPVDGTIGSDQAASAAMPGQNNPLANWGLYHVKNNLTSPTATFSPATFSPADAIASTVGAVLNDLIAMAEREGDAILAAVQAIRTQVVDPFQTLTIDQVLTRLGAIVADLLLNSAENVLVTVIELLQACSQGALELLTAPIQIPILSALYSQVAGEDMCLLDLPCLVLAIFGTVIDRLSGAPVSFPQNAATSALVAAPDFVSLQRLFTGGSVATPAAAGAQTAAPIPPNSEVHG